MGSTETLVRLQGGPHEGHREVWPRETPATFWVGICPSCNEPHLWDKKPAYVKKLALYRHDSVDGEWEIFVFTDERLSDEGNKLDKSVPSPYTSTGV